MNNLFRGLIAGYGAKKLGGGCFSTILVFVLLWVLLGQCGATYAPTDAQTPDAHTESVSAPPSAPAAVPLAAAPLALAASD